MGIVQPVRTVTSGCTSVQECIASGADAASLLEKLGVLGPQAVTLHIGSGLGRIEQHLRTQVRHCHGVDVSPSMVRRARRLVHHDNVTFHCSDGRNLSAWPNHYFNLIYSFLVFQHLPPTQFCRYVSDAHSKLVPGGHLVFQLMVDDNLSHPDPPANHPYGLRYYKRAYIEQLLYGTGFASVIRTDHRGELDNAALPEADVVFCATKMGPAAEIRLRTITTVVNSEQSLRCI